ncbi:hypothetical protein Cob_v001301 [Colletotrichum orbiculare MAFF 240422]|uniref:Gpi anchored protein n=1 Tax=Colletotrichum orbiculare (strain 104-T / ATCC 96160 / CBS 514.97 / LARS 414 / MAFF 240422) TaxID=1213857 RepID=N4W5N2_COLOR|nr:hypothetical protein Cob_v001301 [Colletotrichum orbiculare MAFF 240422]
MKFSLSLCLFALASLGVTEDIDEHDVPQACLSDCRSLLDLSAKCENQTDGDSAFNRCVCNDGGATSSFDKCAVCAKQNGFTSTDDNDVASLMQDCGLNFDAASATPNTTASVVTSTVTSVSGSDTLVQTMTATQTDGTSETSGSASGSASTAAAAHATAAAGVVLAGFALGLPVFV